MPKFKLNDKVELQNNKPLIYVGNKSEDKFNVTDIIINEYDYMTDFYKHNLYFIVADTFKRGSSILYLCKTGMDHRDFLIDEDFLIQFDVTDSVKDYIGDMLLNGATKVIASPSVKNSFPSNKVIEKFNMEHVA